MKADAPAPARPDKVAGQPVTGDAEEWIDDIGIAIHGLDDGTVGIVVVDQAIREVIKGRHVH